MFSSLLQPLSYHFSGDLTYRLIDLKERVRSNVQIASLHHRRRWQAAAWNRYEQIT